MTHFFTVCDDYKLKIFFENDRRIWGYHANDEGRWLVIVVDGRDSKMHHYGMNEIYIRAPDKPWIRAHVSRFEWMEELTKNLSVENYYNLLMAEMDEYPKKVDVDVSQLLLVSDSNGV